MHYIRHYEQNWKKIRYLRQNLRLLRTAAAVAVFFRRNLPSTSALLPAAQYTLQPSTKSKNSKSSLFHTLGMFNSIFFSSDRSSWLQSLICKRCGIFSLLCMSSLMPALQAPKIQRWTFATKVAPHLLQYPCREWL